MRAACHALVVVALVLGIGAGLVGPASATTAADGDGEVSCPARVAGVPFTSEPEFAGTTRPLANSQGVLVRFSLLCPYARGNAAPAYTLTLEYALFEADDLKCKELEITSEDADGGGIQGVLDDPNVSARVSYEAPSADDLPAVRDAATQMLADVPSDAFPCEGGPATGVDGAVAVPEDRGEEDELGVGAIAVFAVIAGFGAMIVAGALIAGRLRKRRKRKAAKAAALPSSGIEGLEVFRRQRPDVPPATQTPEECWARVQVMDEQLQELGTQRDAMARTAEQLVAEVEALDAGLAVARADVATLHAHVAAIRNVASSDVHRLAYLSSYAGLTTLAAAGTNLLAAGAHRAAALVPTDAVRGAARRIDEVARETGSAAELGLDDSRFWLWAERRHAVAHALAVLAEVAPRQAELQRGLIARVVQSGERRTELVRQCDEAVAAVESLDDQLADLTDERNRQATTAQILEDRARADLVPTP